MLLLLLFESRKANAADNTKLAHAESPKPHIVSINSYFLTIVCNPFNRRNNI